MNSKHFTKIVTAGIIFKNEEILLAQRAQGSHLELYWEFPGGKLKYKEDIRACLKREIKEELDIEISVHEVFEVVTHFYPPDNHILLVSFICKYLKGEPRALYCNAFKWVNLSDIPNFKLAPADLPIVKKLLKMR